MENESESYALPSSHAIPLILTFCAISAFFIYLVYSKNIEYGSKIGGWTYGYFEHIVSIPVWIPIVVLLLTGVFIYNAGGLIQNHEKLSLAGCFLIAAIIQILIHQIYPYPMDQIITSDRANSFYTPALQHSPSQILSQFFTLLPTFHYHATSNMPGKILFFRLLTSFTISPLVIGYLTIAFSTLGGLFLYGISKNLFHDKTVALYSFVLYSILPAKLFFIPILNIVTPVFILFCLYLFLIYLDSKKKIHLIFLGIALYFLVLFEPSPLVTGLLFVAVLLPAIGQKKVTVKDLIPIPLIPIFTFAAVYLLFSILFSFNLWQVMDYMVKEAVQFNEIDNRSYLIWLKENVKEFFYGAGPPVMMIFIYFTVSIFSQWKMVAKNILHWSTENIYVLSLIFTFCVVLFFGVNRGETTRLWIYLAVFFQIPAAFFMAKVVKNNTLFYILAATLIAQSFVTLQRIGFVIP